MVGWTRKTICPFCFHAFALSVMRFRCLSPTCKGREIDILYAEVRGTETVTMGRVLLPGKASFGNIPHEALCDVCKTISHTRLCPFCHFELPHDVGHVDQRIIAIIGGRATGKTHYIASLITRLQHDVGKNFGFTVRMLGDQTQERWERDFYTPLFVRKTILQPSRPAQIDPEIKSPLIFRLTFNGSGYRRVLNLSFFDSAGEDMSSLVTMALQNRYITYADGIIFLLDPLQIPNVRQQLTSVNFPPADLHASPEYIVGRLRDLFERERRLRPTQKVKVPIAFTLSKIDTLFPLLEPGSEFHHAGHLAGLFDLDDVQSVHSEIQTYLSLWMNPNFCNIIHSSFARYNYFGISSLGEQPDQNNRLSAINPIRVEDPFLWILHQFGLIRGKRRR
jgi:GTPase SAR1 family protein